MNRIVITVLRYEGVFEHVRRHLYSRRPCPLSQRRAVCVVLMLSTGCVEMMDR